MEIINVSGPPPEDTNSPEYLEWHEREFVMRGNLVLNQSSQIEALQAHVRSLEMRVGGVVEAARGLVKPPKPLELVEDKNEAELPDRGAAMEEQEAAAEEEAALEMPEPEPDESDAP